MKRQSSSSSWARPLSRPSRRCRPIITASTCVVGSSSTASGQHSTARTRTCRACSSMLLAQRWSVVSDELYCREARIAFAPSTPTSLRFMSSHVRLLPRPPFPFPAASLSPSNFAEPRSSHSDPSSKLFDPPDNTSARPAAPPSPIPFHPTSRWRRQHSPLHSAATSRRAPSSFTPLLFRSSFSTRPFSTARHSASTPSSPSPLLRSCSAPSLLVRADSPAAIAAAPSCPTRL
mmetsp:Transcript_2920/g.5380  ORF Transcript_2920/g.5380 Transcript_2920/m.5380 type:complete len:233 (+) Transcript_2920:124-822(+)